MTLEEAVRTYIAYQGNSQGIWTDFGHRTLNSLKKLIDGLNGCNMFSPCGDKPDVLTVTYEYIRPQGKKEYTIYRTDENARIKGEIYRFDNDKAAADKFLQLYYENN